MTKMLTVIIREEIVRQYRDNDRAKCPGGVNYYEEYISPYYIASAVIKAMKKKR